MLYESSAIDVDHMAMYVDATNLRLYQLGLSN